MVTDGHSDVRPADPIPTAIPVDVVRELAVHYTAGDTLECLVARYPYNYRKIRTT
ncbi:hypothetical protein GCM10027258_47890 [Amycolatopsis stemonae]